MKSKYNLYDAMLMIFKTEMKIQKKKKAGNKFSLIVLHVKFEKDKKQVHALTAVN